MNVQKGSCDERVIFQYKKSKVMVWVITEQNVA